MVIPVIVLLTAGGVVANVSVVRRVDVCETVPITAMVVRGATYEINEVQKSAPTLLR